MWFWTLGHSWEVQLQADSWRDYSPLGWNSLEPRHHGAGVRAAPTFSQPWSPEWLNAKYENKGVEAKGKLNVIRTRTYRDKGDPNPITPELLRQLSSRWLWAGTHHEHSRLSLFVCQQESAFTGWAAAVQGTWFGFTLGTLKEVVFWQCCSWCQPRWRGSKKGYQRRKRKKASWIRLTAEEKLSFKHSACSMKTPQELDSFWCMPCHRDIWTTFVFQPKGPSSAVHCQTWIWHGWEQGLRKMLELSQTQNIQESNHTEGAQEHAASSTAGKNEVSSLACHLGRRGKGTSRKPGQK